MKRRLTYLAPICTLLFLSVLSTKGACMAHANHADYAPHSSQTGISTSEPLLSFAVISDIHLRAGESDWGTPYVDHVAEKKFATALLDINQVAPHLDGLVIIGDLTVTGMQSDYDELHKILARNPHPKTILYAIGNHEFNSALRNQRTGVLSIRTFPNHVTEQLCISRFLKNTGMPSVYYDKWIAGYHFIVLGSEQSRISNLRNADNAILSDSQLNWLEKSLRNSPPEKPIFIFLHQPLPYSVAGSNEEDIVPATRLRNILKSYPQILFFSGHSHQTLKNQPKTMFHQIFLMFNDSSVRSPALPNHKLAGNSEGLFVQIYDDKVVVRGRDFTNHVWLRSFLTGYNSLY